jgi:hypothetical protein
MTRMSWTKRDELGSILAVDDGSYYWTWRVGQKVLYRNGSINHYCEVLRAQRGDGMFSISWKGSSTEAHWMDLKAVSEEEYAVARVVEG